MEVQLLDLPKQYDNLKNEIGKALESVLKSGRFILGDNVKSLEQNIKKYLNFDGDVIGVASGSDALLLSLMAINIKPNDEVITTPFTFFATAGAISRLGAKPVFVDISLDDYNIDVSKIEEKITSKTKAIITVDLFGNPSDLIKLSEISKKHNLYLIDDACQAIGSEINKKKVGNFADFTCFSFFPTKNLGAYGDGGMVLAKDKVLGEKIRMLRVHGSSKKYYYEYIGLNSRLDEIQAAILNVKLKYLDNWTEKRIKNAMNYNNHLKNIKNIKTPSIKEGMRHVFHQYSILAENRDELRDFLKKNRIQTSIYYPLPLHLQKAFSYLGYKKGDLSNSEYAAEHILSLPIHENLSDDQRNYVISKIKEFYNN